MPRPLLALLLLAAPAAAQTPDPYQPAVEKLAVAAERERAAKGIPALSVALVDDQRLVWAAGFGGADAATVYRAGSVSKLFADMCVMRLVEQGKLDLDAPVSEVPAGLPAGRPGPDDKPITLRLVMGHRAGLVREPPAGHYFDPNHPTLADTVKPASTRCRRPTRRAPGRSTATPASGWSAASWRWSTGKRFEDAVKELVLDPVGMSGQRASSGRPITGQDAGGGHVDRPRPHLPGPDLGVRLPVGGVAVHPGDGPGQVRHRACSAAATRS